MKKGEVRSLDDGTSLGELISHKADLGHPLFGEALHEYLKKHITTTGKSTVPRFTIGLVTSLDEAEKHLKSGYDLLKKKNARAVSFSIDYGHWLNMAFELYSIDKLAGKTEKTWKEWLETTVGIQGSYARKLWEVAKILWPYPLFGSLGLPFSEVYKPRRQIQAMVATDADVAQYWQQAN